MISTNPDSSRWAARSPLRRAIRVGARIVGLLAATTAGYAQNPPQLPPGMTPEQAAQLLTQQTHLADLVRQRLQQSGMTPDQIRARLRAAGYPSNLLDTYLARDTLAPPPPAPGESMVQAMSILGLASFTKNDSLLLAGDTLTLKLFQDSLRVDSLNRADSLTQLRRRLTLFGQDVFRNPTTRFQPIVLGPVDDSYVLGPGDLLVLILTGAVETAYPDLQVTRDGFIIIPRVGLIYVSNLTLGQLKEVLYQRLGRVFSGVTRGSNPKTRFEITVAQVRVNTVRVVGEVAQPGTYRIAATGGVLSGLYEAGGVTERGNFRSVQVLRGSQLMGTADLYDYLLGGRVPAELRLASGDVVFVPVRGARVKIAGEVTRPAIYEMKPGETLRDLIRIAGGLTPLAATEVATIDRILPPAQRAAPGHEHTVLTVSLKDALDSARTAVPLVAGDSVTVFSLRHSPRRNALTVRGSVWQPGTYSLEPGMRLWDLLRMAGGLRPETYEGRAQIVRTFADSTRQLIGVRLDGDPPDDGDNPPLTERDEVTVYSKADFVPARYVAVFGAVRKEGIVKFADSMTLRDAVLLAGGLGDDAYLMEAEISRVRSTGTRGGDTLAVTMRVPLDSSYVLVQSGYVSRPAGNGAAPTVVLYPYDNIFVRRQPGWEVQRNVVITGEVQFAGRYTLNTKEDRLLSLIHRAGGLTPQAYANGIRFFRAEGSAGRIGVDLPQVLRDPRYKDNLVLAAGDSIHIPAYIPTVRVEGAVNSPASVAYGDGADVGYYVTAAGGFSRRADKRATFVQQPNGLIQKGKRPEPGAVIVVPQREAGVGVPFTAVAGILVPLITAASTVLVVYLSRH